MTDQHDAPVDETTAPAATDTETSGSEKQAVETDSSPSAEEQLGETVADDGSQVEAASDSAAPADKTSDQVPAKEGEKSPGEASKQGDKASKAAPPPPKPERPEITALREAISSKTEVQGKVIGWNNGGLHVVVNGVTAFCPRSEIEIGAPKALESYLDQSMGFHVLRVQKRGRRIVLSRRAILQGDRDEKITRLRKAMQSGEILDGKISSLTDFGAFVDLGGIDGLVHVSELSRSRIEHPSELVAEGDSVKVRVLKIGDDGKRVSLSMKALEPDPWDGLEEAFPAGSIVKGTVERIAKFGAFIEIAPGITGLLPTSAMNLPRNANPARIYNAGKEISVQILSIDRRRRRISLSLEGSQVEATRADLKTYLQKQDLGSGSFGALAAAFDKAQQKKDE